MIRFRARSSSARRIAPMEAALPEHPVESVCLVTGWGAAGYNQYAQSFEQTAQKNLSADVTVIAYVDDETPRNYAGRIERRPNCHFEMDEFLEYTAHDPRYAGIRGRRYNYAFDARKFARKAFAFWAGYQEACRRSVHAVAWIDADVKWLAPVNQEWLCQRISADHAVTLLSRRGTHSETGWVAVNVLHPRAWDFVDAFIDLYRTKSLFRLQGWTDSHAFDEAARRIGMQYCYNLTPAAQAGDHPFNTAFYPRLDHLKGEKRKRIGYSEHYAPGVSRVSM